MPITRRDSILALVAPFIAGCGGGGSGASSGGPTLSIASQLNGTTYPLYIYLPPGADQDGAHLPIVYLLQASMVRWNVHWSVKYALIVFPTVAVLLALYHYGVRSTFVGQFLNGRRHPRGRPFTSAPSTSPG